jgi:hypothetical protein
LRRFFTRALFSYLIGLGILVYTFVADLLILSKPFQVAVEGVVGAAALILMVNTTGIGVVTYTARKNKKARPPLWALPATFALIAGLLLAVFSVVGFTDSYPNAIVAFIVGVVSGAAGGLAYTLSIPGLRQDTILQQIRHSLIIGGVIGVLMGLYFFIKIMPQNASGMILVLHGVNCFVSLPIIVVGMLLSFVLGIELGDRYVVQ